MKRANWMIAAIILGFTQLCCAALGDFSFNARVNSMGKAFTAVTDGVTGLACNPASIAELERLELSSSSFDLFGLGLSCSYISGRASIGKNGFGFSYSKVSDSIFPYEESTLSMVLAHGFSKIKVGTALNIFRMESYENGQGLGMDFGFLYEYPLKSGNLNFGLKLNNLFSKVSYTTGTIEELKESSLIGIAYIKPRKVLVSMDIGREELNFGFRCFLSNNFSFQVGSDNGKPACGFTISKSGWDLDYAYLTHSLGNSKRFSINKKF